jgi:gluconokinase
VAYASSTKVVVLIKPGNADIRVQRPALRGPASARENAVVPDYLRELAPLAIIIMGVTGSGKTTLGMELVRDLGCPYLEGDDFHASEAIAKMRASEPLSDGDRWPWLDRIGRAARDEIAAHGLVVAACSALKRRYRDRLRETIGWPVRFVLLDAGREELCRRLAERKGHFMPASLIPSQLETLERPAADEHVLTLDAQQPPTVLRDRTLGWLTVPA